MEKLEASERHERRRYIWTSKDGSDGKNDLESLGSDLELHDRLQKALKPTYTPDPQQVGMIRKFDNSESDYNANDGAVALGVVRAGRTNKVFRPHEVY